MENDSAFQPISPTFAIAGATAAPTAIQLIGSPQSGSQITAKIYNSGAVLVGIVFAPPAALAATQAVIPTPGTPSQVLILAPGEDGTFTVPPGQFWTAVTASSTATAYIQFGFGI
jgi:hypothetical protein